ncbi:glyoxalase [Candidatus Gottesmanbacteria bacterium RIFCSPHIGHO2_02_FULL_39_11]|uniref:Glyoxalase n=1 Tax=Candidatus Gottesmanbacteria bacterium RIFCSPHIGHO2_02_FULL_39_11 TaxID=1798382 RepID=A0A1F5ZWL5_9BACT|nr:MAG: glyoxalase [Candidatus Gottesmanbacteria bacterium RIFCSPHIGHO2_02_FULL_39_11]
MNPVVHFEMPAKDTKRMSDFYSNVFGWETETMGPDMSNYVVVKTTESDEKTGFPKNPGAINGGFYQKDSKKTEESPSFVIAVDDIKEHMKKITEAGGKILNGPDDIPGVGVYASFQDTEGNRVSILQAYSQM